MQTTALLIGTPALCDTLERQLALIEHCPVILGRIHVGPESAAGSGTPVLGTLEQLESVCATRRPGVALVARGVRAGPRLLVRPGDDHLVEVDHVLAWATLSMR